MIDSFEAVALRPSIIRQQWLPSEVAMQEIVEFGKRFGLEQLLLACHAALPSNLTPELINLVRINFLNYRGIDCPWIAEADFLLSPLCRSVDDTLFEVEPMVREILLSELERRYGWQRMQEVATFLLQYLKASQEHREYPGVAQVQEWIAYSYLQPDKVVQELTELLAKSIVPEKEAQVSQYEKIQLATTMEIVARPLKYTARQQDYQHLIHSTRAFARILYGGKELPQLTSALEQPTLIEGTSLDTLFPPGVQQWIRSIAPASTPSTGAGTQKNELPPVEVTEAPVIGSEVERLLSLAGWVIQDYVRADIRSERGVAIRNFPIRPGTGDAEPLRFLLLFVDQQAAGVVVIVEDEQNLIGVEQPLSLSRIYPLLQGEKAHRDPLPFSYETNTRGTRVRFTSYLDPVTRTRSVFAFHRPETLGLWLQQAPANVAKSRTDLLRARLWRMPELERAGLRDVQYNAIVNLEKSLAENRPCTLIEMASGSGKTYMMVNSIYRMIKFGNAQRVLFLVDRAHLGYQALAGFEQFRPPDEMRNFTQLYLVQYVQDNMLRPDAKVCIMTIQRLYALLSDNALERQKEEESLFELGESQDNELIEGVRYNPEVPIETFDVIVIDECHRSIYGEWRSTIEYFDAFVIGLTATPDKRTLGFFNQNLVMKYSYEQAIADGICLDYHLYRFYNFLSKNSLTIIGDHATEEIYVDSYGIQARKSITNPTGDEDIADKILKRNVVSFDQIRLYIQAYHDNLKFIFPERVEVPKTLIFAQNDNHADNIVAVIKEVFEQNDDFVRKITYKVKYVKPEELVGNFRNDYLPRIAVTVDMISTGTDIKPLEVIIFMRAVKNRVYFEQMVGLGARTISDAELRMVTPDAQSKTHFVIIDCVGITERFHHYP